MNGLDLFSGIGGITLGLSGWVRPIAYCEIEPYCQSILLQRMQEGNLPKAPIWDDIRTLPANELPAIDIIYGGFPCQDISVAGAQKGLEGERSGLFFEILRIIDETKAPFIFLENVPNIRTKGAERVCKELAERGYDCRWCNLSAADVGARHKRERWFLLGYAKHDGLDASEKSGSIGQAVCNDKERENKAGESEGANTPRVLANATSLGLSKRTGKAIRPKEQEASGEDIGDVCKTLPNSNSERLEGQCKPERIQQKYPYISNACGWTIEPDVGRVVTRLPNRTHRIKALGNAVVPLQVRTAFKILIGIN